MEVGLNLLAFGVGLAMVAATVGSAVRTVVLPRGIPAKLSSFIFVNVRRVFRLRLRRTATYEDRDRVMALYGPLSLLSLALAWLVIVLVGYGAMFWALGAHPVREAFTLSGSSLFTLGFLRPDDLPKVALAFTEAALGLTLAGYLALRRIADFFGIPYDSDPDPSGPITVAREEFEEACDRMAAAGVPLVPDRDQAWRDFVGWRVNYDAVLVTLAGLVMAPYAPWSSDRSAAFFRVRVMRRDPTRPLRGPLGPRRRR